MQLHAIMLDLMALTTRASDSSIAPTTTSADPKLRFDQLLGQACTSLVSICQEIDTKVTDGDEIGVANEQDELASNDLSMLAVLLAQPNFAWPASQPNVQSHEGTAVRNSNLSATELPAGIARNVTTEHSSQPLVQADTAGPVPEDTAFILQQPMDNTVSVPGEQPAQSHMSQEIRPVEAKPLVELLEQSQVEGPEVYSNLAGLAGLQTDTGVQPKRWGQLERYWVLREVNEPESEVDMQQAIEDPELNALEVVGSEKDKPLRATAESLTDEAALPALPAQAVDTLAQAKESKQTDQFAAYLDVVVDNLTTPDIAEPADVSYTARPGVPLEQQLEQGLAIGLRQLRLSRSPDGITVRMQLYPESLGEVRVELKLEGSMLSAQLRALQPQATEALRLELPLLRENLVNQGFTQVFLGAETAEHFGQSAGRERQRFQQEQARRTQRVGVVKTETTEELEQEQLTGRLDYRL